MDPFCIETPRLLIRDFCADDLTAYFTMTQQAQYQRYYPEEDYSAAKAKELLHVFTQQALHSPRTGYQLAVYTKDTGRFVGTVGLRMEPDLQASVGFGLVTDFWGTGMALESMAALIQFGFSELGLHRVYAETLIENQSATGLCQRLGMREEARFRQHRHFKHRWWDTAVFAILGAEWHFSKNQGSSAQSICSV